MQLKKGFRRRSKLSAIVGFSLYKLIKSLSIWVLLFLSLVIFSAITYILFKSSKDNYSFNSNFQYSVFVFCNILLIFFILLSIIRIYGRELEDGTYLLFISKPYSRSTIFFLKLFSVWVSTIFFIAAVLSFNYMIGVISNLIYPNETYFKIFGELVLKLFIYCLALAFFASSGIVFAISILRTQGVMLVVVCFCSLFLLGGLPYSLISSLSDNVLVSFTNPNAEKFTIQQINSTLLFNKYLQENKIKFPNITKKIYEFYMQENLDTIDKVIRKSDDEATRIKRMNFYKSLGLTESNEADFSTNGVLTWKGNYKVSKSSTTKTVEQVMNEESIPGSSHAPAPDGPKLINIHISNKYVFKLPGKLDSDNIYQEEIKDMIHYTKTMIPNFETFLSLRKNDVGSLIFLDESESYIKIRSGPNNTFNESSTDPVQIFKDFWDRWKNKIISGTQSYVVSDQTFVDQYIDYFNNPTLFVVKDLENNILKKVKDYKVIESSAIQEDGNWEKYQELMNIYEILSKVNIIEHWNQIWTSSLRLEPFWFEPLTNSKINFDVHKNPLMSYQSHHLKLDSRGVITMDLKPILPIWYLLYGYLAVTIIFILLAWLIFKRKVIT